jgi:metal-sulfur cluster biosynthetic enzyme
MSETNDTANGGVHDGAAPNGAANGATGATAPTEAEVREQLTRLIDPEVGINIVDLGLVYEIHVEDGRVLVVMTLTTRACPLSGAFERAVRQVVSEMPGVTDAHVEFVFDPPWDPGMISEEGRAQLGR